MKGGIMTKIIEFVFRWAITLTPVGDNGIENGKAQIVNPPEYNRFLSYRECAEALDARIDSLERSGIVTRVDGWFYDVRWMDAPRSRLRWACETVGVEAR